MGGGAGEAEGSSDETNNIKWRLNETDIPFRPSLLIRPPPPPRSSSVNGEVEHDLSQQRRLLFSLGFGGFRGSGFGRRVFGGAERGGNGGGGGGSSELDLVVDEGARAGSAGAGIGEAHSDLLFGVEPENGAASRRFQFQFSRFSRFARVVLGPGASGASGASGALRCLCAMYQILKCLVTCTADWT